jgi:4-hydroxybenzoate polyprenyltransferase
MPIRQVARVEFWLAVIVLVAVLALASMGWILDLSPWYLAGVAVVAALLLHEHRIVSPKDLRRLDKAFFDMNAMVGIVYLGASAAGV